MTRASFPLIGRPATPFVRQSGIETRCVLLCISERIVNLPYEMDRR